ncbi:MAG TPA: AAA family ATPase, partial [Euzebya sp.]|nr:AAA family ATPase [Euzebya sp.]
GRWQLGVAMGRFNPPHLGHVHLLTTGASKVRQMHVLLRHRPEQTLPAEQRAAWLADVVPDNVTIHLTPDDLPAATELWAERALEVLPGPPDVAFSSEAWGPKWASAMHAAHLAVDPERRAVPVSNGAVREDLRAHFHLLVPAARAALASRVAVIGAPVTGKTTLTRALARTLRTVWAPDHARAYGEGRQHAAEQTWDSEELRRMAAAQVQLVEDLSRRAARAVVLSDTHALCAAVWHHHRLRHDDPSLDGLIAAAAPDHYLVCAPDFPDSDPRRVHDRDANPDADHPRQVVRQAMHEETLWRVQATGVDHTVLRGPHLDRMVTALAVIDRMTARSALR